MTWTQNRRLIAIIGILLTIFVVIGVIIFVRTRGSEIETAARQAVNDWAKQRQLPYEIVRMEVGSNINGIAQVALFALFTENQGQRIIRVPRETVVEVRKIGEQWSPQPILQFDSPFSAMMLTSSTEDSNECAEASRQEPYPCLRIINNGYFDWNFSRLHWVGIDWGGGWVENVALRRYGGQYDVANSFFLRNCDVGLEDESLRMLIVLINNC